uniref:WD_REPEATS_REGION domain-containing protein n=1 Tax=Rhabditophanes sp. KR3021 TaxID=114890 RepID=A0AC35UHK3_9BILA
MSKHSSTVYDMLMFYKNGQKHMISSGGKGEINLWSWNKNKPDILKHLKLYKFDEDLRVISIAICPNYSGDESTVRPILCVLSDGSIYSLTIKDSHFSVMDKFVEDVKWMFTKIVGIGCNKFASITTHGYLYIFEVSDCGVIFHAQTIHIESCGLSALAFSQDNCIIVGSESGRIHIVSDYVKVAEARYHTSTCTGICAKRCEKGEINIFSVSLDCRISHYSFNGKRKELIFQKGKVLSISDPACVTESYGKILISGAGIEQLDRKIFEI